MSNDQGGMHSSEYQELDSYIAHVEQEESVKAAAEDLALSERDAEEKAVKEQCDALLASEARPIPDSWSEDEGMAAAGAGVFDS